MGGYRARGVRSIAAVLLAAAFVSCRPDPETPAASFLSLLFGSLFDARVRVYHAAEPGPSLRCDPKHPDNDCVRLFDLPHVPFRTCGEAQVLLKRLYACRYAAQRGLRDCPLDDTDTLRALRRMVPRMTRFFELGADMQPGGGAGWPEAEDGYCSECQVRGGCAFSSGGYAGPRVEGAIHWAILLRRDFGAHWGIEQLDGDFDRLVRSPEQIGVDSPLFFNQFNYPSGNQLLWAEARCDEGLWRDGFETQNERFWRFRTTGAREIYAVHYAVHHWDQVVPLTALREPRAAAQARAMVDFQLALYSATSGAGHYFAPLHVRHASGQLWQGTPLERHFAPIMRAFLGIPMRPEDESADSLPFQAWTATSYRPSAALQRLAFAGEREVWWRVHNSLGARMAHASHSWVGGGSHPLGVVNTVPQQCYVAPREAAMLCAQHQRSNDQGIDLAVHVRAPAAPGGVLTGVHVQSQVAGDTFEDGSTLFGRGEDPEDAFHGNPDGAQWILPGRFGALGIRLIDARAHASRWDGQTPVIRGFPDTRLMLPIHAESGARSQAGRTTCDGGLRAGLACTPGEDGRSADCPGAQDTCNRWHAVEIGDVFVGVRVLGEVAQDGVAARPARFTAVPGDPHTVCRGPGDPVGCRDLPDFYHRIRTKRSRAAGSLWWLAHREHGFSSMAGFLSFLESLSVAFEARAAVAGGGTAPSVVAEGRDQDGSPLHLRLDYWRDRDDRGPTRYVCEAADPAQCPWPALEVDLYAPGSRHGVRHGPLAAWTLPARAPLISWDDDDGVLRIHDAQAGDVVHRWHDLFVDTEGQLGAPEALPAMSNGGCGS